MNATKKKTKIFAHIAAVLTVICWGCSFLSTKILMVDGGFTPVEMYSFRFFAAYIVILLLTFRKIFANNIKDELLFLVCGMCSGSIYFIVENFALQNTTAGNVSLLASISPLFTAILLSVFFKVRVRNGLIVGSLIAFVGVACIILSSGNGFELHPQGDLLALLASLSWAVYSIAVKKLLPVYKSLFITRKLFFYGVLTSLPILFIETPISSIWEHLCLLANLTDPIYLGNFAFLVLICSVSAYLLWNEVMKSLGTVMANNYLYGQPLVTMISGAFILHEPIRTLGYVGCVLIIGGLILSDKLKIGRRDRLDI